MNAARVAALLRELADEIDPARAAEPDGAANDVEQAPRRRRPVTPARPPVNPPTELARAKARDSARRLGLLVREKP